MPAFLLFHLCLCLQILVVANPANTNALMLKEHAPSIPTENITALTRLDHNRALAQVRLAHGFGIRGSSVTYRDPSNPICCVTINRACTR